MIVFTQDKYIPTSADIFQLSAGEEGYVLISKDVYDSLLDLQTRGTVEELFAEFKVEKSECIKYFLDNVPTPLNYLSILFSRVTFEPVQDLEVLFGICSAITEPQTFSSIISEGDERFKLRDYGTRILKEYVLPRKVFLTSCIPFEELLDPDRIQNKINVLVLGNGGVVSGNGMNLMGGTTLGHSDSSNPYMSNTLDNDPDSYKYYIARKDDYMYFGDGVFCNKDTEEFIECDVFDNNEINNAFGIVPPAPLEFFAPSGEDEVEKAKPTSPAVEASDGDDGNFRKSAAELFAFTRQQRN